MLFPRLRLTLWPLALAALAVMWSPRPGRAQIMSARRMAMGGVTLMHGGPGSDIANVAYRAVPIDPRERVCSFSLPLGVIQTLRDKPSFDTKDSTFNAFKLADLGLHLPWNIALTKPKEPADDVTITVSRTSLVIDLGVLRDIIPTDRMRFADAMRGPAFVLGVKRAFIGISPYVNVQNDFQLGDALRDALHDGRPFVPFTTYGLHDHGTAQAAVQAMAGGAFALVRASPQSRDGVYVGARARVLRGMAYADANETVSFTTPDTLFGTAPLDLNLDGRMRSATPSGGGIGHGFDAGVVFVARGVELGLAANDLSTSIDWKVKETRTAKDSTSGDYKTVTVATDQAYTSTIPASYLLTAATHLGDIYVAADAVRDGLAQMTGHIGAEYWLGAVALRGGAWDDSAKRVQVSGGIGVRLGRIGLDVALATNQENLTHERTLDLGAGLSWYPRRKS